MSRNSRSSSGAIRGPPISPGGPVPGGPIRGRAAKDKPDRTTNNYLFTWGIPISNYKTHVYFCLFEFKNKNKNVCFPIDTLNKQYYNKDS